MTGSMWLKGLGTKVMVECKKLNKKGEFHSEGDVQ